MQNYGNRKEKQRIEKNLLWHKMSFSVSKQCKVNYASHLLFHWKFWSNFFENFWRIPIMYYFCFFQPEFLNNFSDIYSAGFSGILAKSFRSEILKNSPVIYIFKKDVRWIPMSIFPVSRILQKQMTRGFANNLNIRIPLKLIKFLSEKQLSLPNVSYFSIKVTGL